MAEIIKQGFQKLKRKTLWGRAAITIALATVIAALPLSLPVSAETYQPNANDYPSVISPVVMLQGAIPKLQSWSNLEGIYFQSERGKTLVTLTQPQNAWLQSNDAPLKNSDIPNNLKSTLVSGGWYDTATPYLARFRGTTTVNDRNYSSINFAVSFPDLPITSNYVNFEIYLYARSCLWENASDSLPGELNPSVVLRFDTADATKIGMGYYQGNYFVNVGSTSVARTGDWLRVQMKVPSSQLSSVTTLQLGLNGTPETTTTMEKAGVIYLDFDFTSLICYSETFDGYRTTADNAYNFWYNLIFGNNNFGGGDNFGAYDSFMPEPDTFSSVLGVVTNTSNLMIDFFPPMQAFSTITNTLVNANVYLTLLVSIGMGAIVIRLVLLR